MSLARKKHAGLLATFEASFDGNVFTTDTFDSKFFLESARDIVREEFR